MIPELGLAGDGDPREGECSGTTDHHPLSSECEAVLKLSERVDGCDLIKDLPAYSAPLPGLSDYWAQEYTGADLLRSVLEKEKKEGKVPSKLPADFVHILDSGTHGIKVSHLISSTHPSAAIPLSALKEEAGQLDFDSHYAAYSSKSVERKRFPKFINHSMYWNGSPTVYESFKLMSEGGTIAIVAADNHGNHLERVKSKAARELDVLLVGSLRADGFPAIANYGPEVLISAPSASEVLTIDEKGKPTAFSGTSGAAPQVTSALAAFSLITGHDLTKEEAERLIRKTAVKSFHSYADPPMYGAGILNTYKIGRIAQRIRDKCKRSEKASSSCVGHELKADESYRFPITDLSKEKAILGDCFSKDWKWKDGFAGPTTQVSAGLSFCEVKQAALARIRGEALLNPGRKDLWEGISCVYAKANFGENAVFYRRIAQIQTESDYLKMIAAEHSSYASPDIIRTLLTQKNSRLHPEWVERILEDPAGDDRELIVHVLGRPEWKDRPDWVAAVLGRSDDGAGRGPVYAEEIAIYILSKPYWVNHPEFVEKLIANPMNAANTHAPVATEILTQPHWKKHPELLDKLVATGKADHLIIGSTLHAPHWSDRWDLIEKFALSGKYDRELGDLFREDHWKNHTRAKELLGDRPLTARNLRDVLQK